MKSQLGEDINQRVINKYTRSIKLGEGTYAVVYLGFEVKTNRKVAIKKIKVGSMKSGLDMSAIREVKALRELKHPNVIELIDVFTHKTNLNLVLEYLDTDLEMVIKDKSLVFMPSHIKSWMLMMLKGLEHCHRSWILHRDMKPNNLLIAGNGVLKLADFGLAREYGDINSSMTSQTVTRWYRAPELLFGSRQYTGAIDMWAVGCIFAELMLRVPFVAGNSDMNQLDLIFHALGTPTESDWPGMTKLPDYVKFERTYPKTDLRSLFTGTGADALELLKGMLEYDPKKRLTARQALASQYFRNQPLPTLPQDLPKPSANPIVESESETTRQQVDKKRKVDQAFAEIVDNGDETQTAWKSKLEPVAKKLEFVRSPAA